MVDNKQNSEWHRGVLDGYSDVALNGPIPPLAYQHGYIIGRGIRQGKISRYRVENGTVVEISSTEYEKKLAEVIKTTWDVILEGAENV